MIEVFAPAKVNLTLHITGKRADGYHLLDSLVVFTRDVGDVIRVARSEEMRLTIDGPFANGVPTDETNLVLRAAKALAPNRTAAITVTKNLPHGAGIGGGSADAAATLKALTQLWDMGLPNANTVLSLGADVPVCLAGPAPMLMSGIGEVLHPTPPLPELWMVLVSPGKPISTAGVFRTLSEDHSVENPPQDAFPTAPDIDEFLIWLAGGRNDLTHCAAEQVPEIIEIIDRLWSMETCEDADMSGSGSTCRGVFETETAARAAAEDLRQVWPDYWIEVTAVA